MFSIQPGSIKFSDVRGAEHGTMFGPNGKLALNYLASTFNDWDKTYAWVFDLSEIPKLGDVFTFAAVGREVSYVVIADGTLRPCNSPEIVRNDRGVPVRIVSEPPPPLTILIVTMNRRDLLEIALWYIYETSADSERDIWIWDNASVDDTPAFLGMMAKWPGVRCFRSEINVGHVEARRRMARQVQTPYIFSLDDDMWLLNRGWAGGVSRILAADPSIYQIAISITGHWHNNYGIVHTVLDRPFFRVPYLPPMPRLDHEQAVPEGAEALRIAGDLVMVPTSGRQMPFAVSGSASAWRTADILALEGEIDRHPVMDLSEAWGHSLRRRYPDRRDATVFNYQVVSPTPGPIWHLGRGEMYWARRCEFAPEIYNRSSEEQRRWLEVARMASGWGAPTERAEDVCP